ELTPSAKELPQASASEEVYAEGEPLGAVLTALKQAPRLALHLGGDQYGAVALKLKAPAEGRVYLLRRQEIPAAGDLLSASMPAKACHDLKRHIALLRHYKVELGGVEFDTMLAGFLVNPGKPEPSIADLYHDHLAPLGGNTSVGSEPAVVDALRQTLGRKLADDRLESLFTRIELPVARVLAELESDGIGI